MSGQGQEQNGGTKNYDDDNRPLVKDLLEQYASGLSELRKILEKEDTFHETYYDDVWMLRFLLSNKKFSSASAAAIKTMKFREEHKLNELGDICHKFPDFEAVKKYSKFCKATAVMYAQPDPDRGLIQIVFPDQIDLDGLVDEMDVEALREVFIKCNEMIYQILDEATRRTGKLTKLLRIVDASDYTLSHFNYAYSKLEGAATKPLQDLYPQMLGRLIVCNLGGGCTTVWRIVKPMLPKQVVEKVVFVQPLKNPKDIKHFLRYISIDNLWERYGGNNSVWPVPKFLRRRSTFGSLLERLGSVILSQGTVEDKNGDSSGRPKLERRNATRRMSLRYMTMMVDYSRQRGGRLIVPAEPGDKEGDTSSEVSSPSETPKGSVKSPSGPRAFLPHLENVNAMCVFVVFALAVLWAAIVNAI